MSTARLDAHRRHAPLFTGSVADALRSDPAYQSFWLLRIGFTVAPIVFGADKFANVRVNWEKYLAPWVQAFTGCRWGREGSCVMQGILESAGRPAWRRRLKSSTSKE